jgi:hypothetical protein
VNEASERALRVLQETNGSVSEPLEATMAVFRKWLHLPDPAALLAVLGTVAANRLDGDPVWTVLVGPPGGGKSEIIQSLAGLDDVHPVATLTEPALLSGTARKEQAANARGGLLRVMGEFGIILCKDFGSVLSMHRDARAQVLAALREVYDGHWTRHLGVDGGRTLDWSGKVGLVGGCTPTIDRHHAVMGAMGERFLLFRLPEADSAEQARRALEHAGREKAMRAELAEAVQRLLVGTGGDPRPLSKDETARLVSLTQLVVRCRSAVERDGYSREIELIPESEAPTRLIVVLAQLLAGLDAIGVGRLESWAVVTKAALDSIPAIRRDTIGVLFANEAALKTSEVAEAISYPTATTQRALEDLTAHGIAKRHAGHANTWTLSEFAREHYGAAIYSPETSGYAQSLSNKPKTIRDDISGE